MGAGGMRGRKEHYEPTPVFSQFVSPRGLIVKNSLNRQIELSPPCLFVVNRLSISVAAMGGDNSAGIAERSFPSPAHRGSCG